MPDRTSGRGTKDLVTRLAERTDRAPHAFGKSWIAPQALRGTVAQQVGRAAPGQRDADIRERQRLRAKAPLVIIVADAQVEMAHALFVQRRHRPLDAEQARRAV